MKKIKVLFVEPRHHTVERHSSYTPVGIGYIAAYMLKMIKLQNPNIEIDVKISIDPLASQNSESSEFFLGYLKHYIKSYRWKFFDT